MKKRTSAIIFIYAVIFLAGLGTVLMHRAAFKNVLVAVGLEEAQVVSANPDPYIKRLQSEFPVLKIRPKKKKDRREIWFLGKGVSFPNYLLRAQRHLENEGGKVLKMEEVRNRNNSVSVLFDFVAPFADTFRVELQTDETFLDSTSSLAIGFFAGPNLEQFAPILNKLTYPYSLLITPSEKEKLKFGLRTLSGYETVLWIPMESKSKLPKEIKSVVYIHLSKSEIQEIMTKAFADFPEASGVASRFGDRAVEQKALLNAMFLPMQDRNLWFLDLSDNRYSKSDEACQEIGLECLTPAVFNPNRMTHEVYVSNALKRARRSGSGIVLLPLSTATFNALENIEAVADSQGTKIVTLSRIFQN